MDIATGNAEPHLTDGSVGNVLHGYDAAGGGGAGAGVAPPTPIVPGQLHGPTIDAPDWTAQWQAQREAGEADARAAQASAQNAENDRRDRYGASILPLGGDYGTQMDIPPVPAASSPPAQSFLYPRGGDEPTMADEPYGPYQATAYHGNEPL